ncbi:hypothetical protein J2Y73_005178 [Peribacillus frigoritolerans]|uniref:hypothetical protein n=1 Tax=Peribacillus frigoritolerans TaxID=450367 RepID=UPI002815FA59|nr:hypothetical protein [Peribacillus frigoritolerans]MCP1495147.1 hypothetical protein [Peribacillus frigoritolerans]
MTAKNYYELIKDHILIGGANDVKDMIENEKADIIFDLRAVAPDETEYNRLHSPIVDDAEHQDESIKKSIGHVVKAIMKEKKCIFTVLEEQSYGNRCGWYLVDFR